MLILCVLGGVIARVFKHGAIRIGVSQYQLFVSHLQGYMFIPRIMSLQTPEGTLVYGAGEDQMLC